MKEPAEPSSPPSAAQLHAALLDYFSAPGKYQLTLRQPTVLFASVRDILQLAVGRTQPAGVAPAEAAALHEAAMFFIRAALLYPGADHYAVLGLPSRTEPVELKERYRLLMRLTHPDFTTGPAAAWSADAAVRVNRAYEVLSSPVQRREYDEQLAGVGVPPRADAPPPKTAYPPAAARRHKTWQVNPMAAWGLALSMGTLGIWALLPDSETTHLVQKSPQRTSLPAPAAPMPSEPAALVPTESLPQAASPALPLVADGAPAVPVDIRPPAVATDGPTVARAPLPDAPIQRVAPPATSAAPAVAAVAPPAAAPALAARPPSPAAPRPAVATAAAPGQPPAPVGVPPNVPTAAELAAAHRRAVAQVARPPGEGAAVAPPAPVAASRGFEAGVPPPPAPVVAAVPPPPVAAPRPAAGPQAPALSDAQPLLTQLLQQLETGSGDQLLRLLESDARQAPPAQALSRQYEQLVRGARPVRPSNVEFKGETRDGVLLVTVRVRLHAGEPTIGSHGERLLLRAEFQSRGGKVLLTGLSGAQD